MKIREIKYLTNYEFLPIRHLDRHDTLLDSSVPLAAITVANMVTEEAGLLDYVLAYRLFRHSVFLGRYKRFSANRYFLKTAVSLSD